MDKQATVILLGDTVLMDALAVSLKNELQLSIVRMDDRSVNLQDYLEPDEPSMVIFALDTPDAPAVLALLHERPGTIFLGVDHTASQVVVMESKGYPIHSMHEFCQLAQTQVPVRWESKGGEILDPLGHSHVSEAN